MWKLDKEISDQIVEVERERIRIELSCLGLSYYREHRSQVKIDSFPSMLYWTGKSAEAWQISF